jgi:probable F420-dependent oxidoreductase
MSGFRFGFQLPPGIATGDELRQRAREAEAAGFDVFHTWDHVVAGEWGPMVPLQAAAEATERIRVCPLVLNNDFHHPVLLARELASLDRVTGGRVELGIGAGHGFPEYAAAGIAFDPPAVRKARLAEAVEVLRRLLDGEEVTFAGEHYQLQGARTTRTVQDHLPILVGVNGRTALAHAARHADVIGLTMVGRTLEDGKSHEVRWEPDRLDNTVAHIRAEAAAGGRPAPRLHALVQAVVVADDRRAAVEELIAGFPFDLRLDVDDALVTPFLAVGTHDEIADHLVACRDRWGIDYYTVRDIDAFAPVIDRLRARDTDPG